MNAASSWSLEDAQAWALRFPYTYLRPSAQVVAGLKVGDHVKLTFCPLDAHGDALAGRAERMWVRIAAIEGDGQFKGRLANHPRVVEALLLGATVSFEARHVFAVEGTAPDEFERKLATRCLVTHRVLREGARIGYVYRQESEHSLDSGWRFSAGDEAEDYVSDDANFAVVSLGALLNRDDSFLTLLDADVGAEFLRAPNDEIFRRIA